MVNAANAHLDRYQDRPRPFSGGMAEQTLLWQEGGGVWCRARPDWLHEGRRVIDDYKTTEAPAHPDSWGRGQLFRMGYDIQAGFYLRGLKALFGIDGAFRFVVQENYAPFALCVIGLGPDLLALAERKVRQAINLWRACLEENRWPGYPTRTCYPDLPPWEETRWLEREARDAMVPAAAAAPTMTDDGRPLADQLFGEL